MTKLIEDILLAIGIVFATIAVYEGCWGASEMSAPVECATTARQRNRTR